MDFDVNKNTNKNANKKYAIDRQLTCNGCKYLDFKYLKCRNLKEKHICYGSNMKPYEYFTYKELNTIKSCSDDVNDTIGFVTVLKDKDCKGYVARSKSNKNKKDKNRKG